MKHFKLTESERKRISGLYEQQITPIQPIGPKTIEQPQDDKKLMGGMQQIPADLKSKIIELQNLLISKGQSLGRFGADGKIGNYTLTAIENILSGTKSSATPNTNAPAAGTTASTNQPSTAAGTNVGTDPTADANQPLAAKTTSTNPPAATDNNPPED